MSSIRVDLQLSRPGFALNALFEIPSSGITGVLGYSGSGKTTLLRAIAGLEPGVQGSVHLGAACWQDGSHIRPAHQRRVGFVFQQPNLFPHLTVNDNLCFGLRFRSSTEQSFALDAAISLLGIESLLERLPATLSGGEQQRVAIARALASAPELLLFDEPLSALDEQRKAELLPYLERVHRELQVPGLYVSHAISEVTRIADHLLLMEAGEIVANGPIANILTDPANSTGLVGGDQALVVIDAQVADADAVGGLARVTAPGGELLIKHDRLVVGEKLRLQIAARDVSVALSKADDSSIINILPTRIDAISHSTCGQIILRLVMGETILLSCISMSSLKRLNLSVGDSVFAQIKAVAVLT